MFLNGYVTLSRCKICIWVKTFAKEVFAFFQDNEEEQDKEEKAPK